MQTKTSQQHASTNSSTSSSITAPRRRRRKLTQEEATNPFLAAKLAGLHYVDDSMPCIRREKHGDDFIYRDASGHKITDETELERIRHLAIPPAWTNVWICPDARGHIQATGRDTKGRKQYRYHDLWRAVRDATKYHRMIAFGHALPTIRARVREDIALRGLPREKVEATVVQLLDETLIRVGNEEYAQENQHYGITTMHNEHVDVEGATLHFRFTGKSGKKHDVAVKDKPVARIIRRLQELPGEELFEYVDDQGEVRNVGSGDVNRYLQAASGEEFSAKDFRTWGGTVLAAQTLKAMGDFSSQTEGKRKVTQAIKAVAEHLRNTPAVCRKSYVHPGVLDAYLHHLLTQATGGAATSGREHPTQPVEGLRPEEAELLSLLESMSEQEPHAKAG